MAAVAIADYMDFRAIFGALPCPLAWDSFMSEWSFRPGPRLPWLPILVPVIADFLPYPRIACASWECGVVEGVGTVDPPLTSVDPHSGDRLVAYRCRVRGRLFLVAFLAFLSAIGKLERIDGQHSGISFPRYRDSDSAFKRIKLDQRFESSIEPSVHPQPP